MEEHIFPLEADANLRKQITLEIERDNAASRFVVIKKLFFKCILKTALVLMVIVMGYWWTIFPQVSWFVLLLYWLTLVTIINIPEIIFLWREAREAKQHLKSWEAVKEDYQILNEKG